MRSWIQTSVQGLAWDCFRHLGSEPLDGWDEFVCKFLFLSLSVSFSMPLKQKDKYIKITRVAINFVPSPSSRDKHFKCLSLFSQQPYEAGGIIYLYFLFIVEKIEN